ncbi:MAG: hypothetical protein HKN23_21425 [Verrucomicrobiales bacterium]|nr:hypothetical protein [Verrucomicrobiales bacterium]
MRGISRNNLTLSNFEISVEKTTGGISDGQNAAFTERVEILENGAAEIGKIIGSGPLHVGMAQLGLELIGVRSWDVDGVREPKKGVEVADRVQFAKVLRHLD